MSLFNELKRRNVFKVAAAYVIVSWLILQVTGSIVPIIEAPDWVAKAILVLLLAGFPIALLFAWAFEMAHEGIKKESEVVRDDSITSDAELLIPQPPDSIPPQTSSKINLVIIGALVLIIGGFAYDKFFGESSKTVSESALAQNEIKTSDATAKKLRSRVHQSLTRSITNPLLFYPSPTWQTIQKVNRLPWVCMMIYSHTFQKFLL